LPLFKGLSQWQKTDISAVCKFDIPQQMTDFDMKQSHQAAI
jgi:hypothetical protein